MEPFNPDCPIRKFDEALKRHGGDDVVHIKDEERTLAHLRLEGYDARIAFYWPVTGLGASADYSAMLAKVFETMKRHLPYGLVSLTCYMRRRTEAGWLEWLVICDFISGDRLAIGHIQRQPDAEVERHS